MNKLQQHADAIATELQHLYSRHPTEADELRYEETGEAFDLCSYLDTPSDVNYILTSSLQYLGVCVIMDDSTDITIQIDTCRYEVIAKSGGDCATAPISEEICKEIDNIFVDQFQDAIRRRWFWN